MSSMDSKIGLDSDCLLIARDIRNNIIQEIKLFPESNNKDTLIMLLYEDTIVKQIPPKPRTIMSTHITKTNKHVFTINTLY